MTRSKSIHLSRRHKMLASAAFVTAGLVAVPVASAVTPTTQPSHSGSSTSSAAKFDGAKQRCTAAVDKRLDAVGKATARLEGATDVPTGTRTQLSDQLGTVRSDLETSKSAIAAAQDATSLRTACKNMVTSTRVFMLYLPKTRAVLASAKLASIDARIAKDQGRLTSVIERAEKRGVSADKINDAKAAVADAKARLADAHHQIDGLSDELMAITPAQVNDGSAKATLTQARDRIKAAATDAKAIRADAKKVREDLGRRH